MKRNGLWLAAMWGVASLALGGCAGTHASIGRAVGGGSSTSKVAPERAPIAEDSLKRGTVYDLYASGKTTNDGEAAAVVREGRIEINQRILFETASAVLLADSTPILTSLVSVFKANPDIVRVRVEGHTDARGDADANNKLSGERAAAVAKYMREHGVAAQLDSAGFGSTRVVCTSDEDACHQRNRRVEFTILDRDERKTAKKVEVPAPQGAPATDGVRKLREECREVRVGGAHFILCNLAATWRGSRDTCKAAGKGYDLASIHNEAEQKAVTATARESGGYDSHLYFFGLNDLATEGEYTWVDGTPMTMTMWKKDEPNNRSRYGAENCGNMMGSWGDMRWNDMFCDWTGPTKYGAGTFASGFVCRGGARPAAKQPNSVDNWNFERRVALPYRNAALGDCNFEIPGWKRTAESGIWTPTGKVLAAHEGRQVAYLNSGEISQALSTTVQAGTEYTLSMRLGARSDTGRAAYRIRLLAGTKVVASDDSKRLAVFNGGNPDGWTAVSTSFCTRDASLVGKAITIVIAKRGGVQLDVDAVRLTSRPGACGK